VQALGPTTSHPEPKAATSTRVIAEALRVTLVPQAWRTSPRGACVQAGLLHGWRCESRYGLAIPALFAETVLALPRIYVLNPSATHLSYVTGMCTEINQTREAALLADPALPEPLTTRIATNPAAARAYDLWNMGEILFGLLGAGGGSGRNFCNRVGVNSVRSHDTNPQDGFTDSPPFLPTDTFTLSPVIPEEILVPQITLHTVAFWKTFLQGDHRYMRYLTAGYARSHDLEAVVFKID